jgi:hypothetical protein
MILIIQLESEHRSKLVDIQPSERVEVLHQMIQVELGVDIREQELYYNNQRIRSGTIIENGLLDGSVIVGMQLDEYICIC